MEQAGQRTPRTDLRRPLALPPFARQEGVKPRPPLRGMSRYRIAQADVQFAQLLLVHRAGRLRQQALRALGLGEGDDVADRLGAGHHGDDAVQTKGQTAVRWRAVLQRVEQEAELLLRVFGRNF